MKSPYLTSVATALLLLAACTQVEGTLNEIDRVIDPQDASASTQSTTTAPERPEKMMPGESLVTQGLRHFDGDGVPRDEERAVSMFREAAERGNADGQTALAIAYQSGRGVEKDEATAARWLTAAATQGNPEAQFLLGLAFKNGRGVAQSATEAVDWFDRAARQDHIGAAYELGLAYGLGRGVDTDNELASRWFGFAGERGHAEAQFLAGSAASNGRGVPKDHLWAARWYERAANQGLARAQYMMGVYYGAGLGVPTDSVESYRWLTLAAEKGEEEAATLRQRVGQRLSSEERARAETAAQAFSPSRPTSRLNDGPTIRYVQRTLAVAGFDPGPADGLMGPRTAQALEAFLGDRGLPRSLGISDRSLDALRRISGGA